MTPHALAQLAYVASACAAAALMAAALRRHGAVVLRHRRPGLPVPPELHARLVAQGLGLAAQGALAAAVVLQPVAADAAEGLRAVSIMLGAALLALGVLNYGALASFARARNARPERAKRVEGGCVVAIAGAGLAFSLLLGVALLAAGGEGALMLVQLVGWVLAAVLTLLLLPGLAVALLLLAAGAPTAVFVAGGIVAETLFWVAVARRLRSRRLNTLAFERRTR